MIALGFLAFVLSVAAVGVVRAQTETPTATPSPTTTMTTTPTPTGSVQGTTVPEGAPATGYGSN